MLYSDANLAANFAGKSETLRSSSYSHVPLTVAVSSEPKCQLVHQKS